VAFPALWLIDTRSIPLIILVLCVGQIGTNLMYGPLGAYFSELFGANVRYSGASLGYQLASILGGGLAPLIATLLLSWSGNASWLSAYRCARHDGLDLPGEKLCGST
jgi:MFS family permease